jgi:hypothetical protein
MVGWGQSQPDLANYLRAHMYSGTGFLPLVPRQNRPQLFLGIMRLCHGVSLVRGLPKNGEVILYHLFNNFFK